MFDVFWRDLDEGAIHQRDNLQFELKSEFIPNPNSESNTFYQTVYLFIPDSLQINEQTYSKQQFYQDQTNFIRYKTPEFTFEQLLDIHNSQSPLFRIKVLKKPFENIEEKNLLIDEIKLFANIFRSVLRNNVYQLVMEINQVKTNDQWNSIETKVMNLCNELTQLCIYYRGIQNSFLELCTEVSMRNNFHYVDEFICDVIDYYLTALLDTLRKSGEDFNKCDQKLCHIIVKEKQYREKHHFSVRKKIGATPLLESILYRRSLLQRFVLEALELRNNRIAVIQEQSPFLGAFAAGFAMLVYLLLFLFVWKSTTTMINSIPFVLSLVVFYILKDRIKEGVKSYYSKHAIKWFPDFSTTIQSPRGRPVGKFTETVIFLNKNDVPKNIFAARKQEFHHELETLQRHETIIQCKRTFNLYSNFTKLHIRRQKINTIFRFNVHQFIEKINDSFQLNLNLDLETLGILEEKLPKVYHLNIIIQNNYLKNNEMINEIKKFRIILNKWGINRVEHIHSL